MKVFHALMVGMLLPLTTISAEKATIRIEEFKIGTNCAAPKTEAETLHLRLEDVVRNTRKFDVVERTALSEIVKEHRLVDAGLTEGDAPESNSLKAACYEMYGTIIRWRISKTTAGAYAQYKFQTEIQLRFANITTGKILGVKTVKATAARPNARDAIDAGVSDIVRDAANLLVEVAFPTTVLSVNSNFVTVNLTAEQCKVGDVYEVFELGDELTDPATGDSLGFDEDLVGEVSISRPGPKTTKCVVCPGTNLNSIQKGMVLRKVDRKITAPKQKHSLLEL